MITLILLAVGIWVVLAVVGIHRGLCRQLVVFRGWGDVALTGTLAACATWGLVAYLKSSELSALLPMILAIVPWLWVTKTANPGWPSLLLTIPAKLSLLALLFVCALLALSAAYNALSRKPDAHTRLANAALAAGTASAAWFLFRTLRQLAAASTSNSEHSEHQSHVSTVLSHSTS